MKSIYKSIGDYIQEVNIRNTDLKIDNLLGINIDKFFMPSVANVIGTDMTKYKIVKQGQFACNRMHVGRDKRLPVALLRQEDAVIVSPAYDVFEIIDKELLDPEYLMMWFSRKEFDRNTWFYTDADVRGGLKWNDFCNMKLPVPHITKQKEIVREYNVLIDRIKLNNNIIQKLEITAQAIFKRWFVDFEFPDENGKPYKSSGGEMVFNNNLDMEIPKGWGLGILDDVVNLIISHRGKSKSTMELNNKDKVFNHPVISAMNVSGGSIVKHDLIRYADNITFKEWMKDPLEVGDVIMTSEAPLGELLYIAKRKDYILSQRLFAIRVDKTLSRGVFLYYWLKNPIVLKDLEGRATGTTVLGIKLSELKKLIILKPLLNTIIIFENKVQALMKHMEEKKNENEILNELRHFMLSTLAQTSEVN
ncbi:restriction endonuclease subunit S [Fictibacillus phosphorivorans]|uniref:restriction endonuclease subunit S n=1 Tax=Fictibacillus phosphorivorans TaxID=1221500 RepID=UPI003CEE3483